MSKPDAVAAHSFPSAFPPDFPVDTEYLMTALEEWNRSRGTDFRFLQLTAPQMTEVLRRASWLKQAARAGRS